MPTLAPLPAYAAGLVLTLCLAAWLTPRAWWRRANARAGAVLAGGTLVLGGLLAAAFAPSTTAAMAAPPVLAPDVPVPDAPVAGARYLVRDHLNLRADTGVNARRLAVVPAGAQVTATGVRRGDWWQVEAEVGGRRLDGWASSLWLRRADEGRSGFF